MSRIDATTKLPAMTFLTNFKWRPIRLMGATVKITAFLLLSLLLGIRAHAQSSPEGLWMSFDDDGKTPMALIRIVKANGMLNGRIEKVLDVQSQTETVCSRCSGDRKNQPIVGLEIIRGVKPEPQNSQWSQGQILDPDDGAEYRLVMELRESGKQLKLRGYLGPFWRTQLWLRKSNN